MKVAIVSFEYPGLTKNGGIGTAYGRLAETLASNDHQVTIYFVDIGFRPSSAPTTARVSKNIRIQIIPTEEISGTFSKETPWPLMRSLTVLKAIENSRYDVIHFHDCLGLAWAAGKLHKYGVLFKQTRLILGMHGPNFWVRDAHQIPTTDPYEFIETAMERECFQDFDLVISPSQYLLDFLAKNGWSRSSDRAMVIPNISHFETKCPDAQRKFQIRKIVFFGRLESRKGIFLFADALLALASSLKKKSKVLQIDFLGRDTILPNKKRTTDIIRQMLKDKPHFKLNFLTDYDSEQCRRYFQQNRNALVVMPSLSDNSPYAVVECLEQGMHFICTNAGGQTELLEKSEGIAVPPTPEALANAMLKQIQNQFPLNATPSLKLRESKKCWIKFHESLATGIKKSSLPLQQSVDIVIKSDGDLHKLSRTLNSLGGRGALFENVFIYIQSHHDHHQRALAIARVQSIYRPFKIFPLIIFGGGIDEIFLDVQKRSRATHLMPLLAGDELKSDFLSSFAKILKSKALPDVVCFGMQINGQTHFPTPLTMENHFLFDYYEKFPMLFRRTLSLDGGQREDYIGSYYFSLKTDLLLELLLDGLQIEALPLVSVSNDERQVFYPHWLIRKSEFANRIARLRGKMTPLAADLVQYIFETKNNMRMD